jgi:hypothetical protein
MSVDESAITAPVLADLRFAKFYAAKRGDFPIGWT